MNGEWVREADIPQSMQINSEGLSMSGMGGRLCFPHQMKDMVVVDLNSFNVNVDVPCK